VASAAALWRVLRLAVAQGVLAGSAGAGGVVRFSNTAASATLRADHPSTVRWDGCSRDGSCQDLVTHASMWNWTLPCIASLLAHAVCLSRSVMPALLQCHGAHNIHM
jgi:hypothetical protein